MFWRSIVGRLLSLLVTLAIGGVLWLTVGKDVLDDVQSDTERQGGGGPQSERIVDAGNFGPMVKALRREVGRDARMLSVTLRPTSAEFVVRDGDSALGYRSEDGGDDLERVQVNVTGPGGVREGAWPISKLDPDAPERMARAISDKEGGDFHLSLADLERQGSGKLVWVMRGTIGERGVAYAARPDGSKARVYDPGSDPDVSSVPPSVSRLTDCVRRASGDPQALQECTRRYGAGG